jgi:hypothetical protein
MSWRKGDDQRVLVAAFGPQKKKKSSVDSLP